MDRLRKYIDEVKDADLRERLRKELDRFVGKSSLGIIFQEHESEQLLVPSLPPRAGSLAVNVTSGETARVTSVGDAVETDKGSWPRNQAMRVASTDEPLPMGLKAIEAVGGGNDPAHLLIEGENFHALEALLLVFAGKVDCIYIDPPYNTGAHDWKYNNDYVDPKDQYPHSLWLSMMERRLLLARKLLAPEGVLIVTIDENEHAHLVMLLERVFPNHTYPKRHIDSIAIIHNPRGIQGDNFSYVHENAVFVTPLAGKAIVDRVFSPLEQANQDLQWLRKWGNDSTRDTARNCFYPILIKDGQLAGFGAVPDDSFHPAGANVERPDGTIEVWPVDIESVERKWRYEAASLEEVKSRLRLQRRSDGMWDFKLVRDQEPYRTVWSSPRFDASSHGKRMLSRFVDSDFSFPKSLYAVKECLRAVTGPRAPGDPGKKDPLILDFFGGSGTTLHAALLLNKEDGKKRRCILVTNNEVEEKQGRALIAQGILPGSPDFEKHGICRSVTWPRIQAAVSGKRADGNPVEGDYILHEKLGCEECLGTDRYVFGAACSEGLPGRVQYVRLQAIEREAAELDPTSLPLRTLYWAEYGAAMPPLANEMPVTEQYAVLDEEHDLGRFLPAAKSRGSASVWIHTRSASAIHQVTQALGQKVRVSEIPQKVIAHFEDCVRQSASRAS